MVADEYIVLYQNSLAEEAVARNLASFANFYPLLYFDKGSDFRIVSNFAAVEVGEGMNGYVEPQLYVRRY